MRSSRAIAINLAIMIYIWSSISFTYYLASFQLKYLPGDIFDNSIASAFAQSLGIIISGVFTKFFNKKQALIISYAISFVGGLLILFFGESSVSLMPFFVGVARIGISAGFNLIYLMNAEVFPTLFAATAMGICNLLARIITILSP